MLATPANKLLISNGEPFSFLGRVLGGTEGRVGFAVDMLIREWEEYSKD